MRPLVGDHIEQLKPYVPGKPIEELERELGIEGAIKLASNENPLGPSPLALQALQDAHAALHIYPDGAHYKLKEALAAHHQREPAQVLCGNGSNEVLTLAVRTFLRPGDRGLMFARSFVAYRVILQAAGLGFDEVELGANMQPDIDDLLEALRPETKIVFLANANNPTGVYLPGEDIERLARELPEEIVLVVDEAYHHYVTASDYRSALDLQDLRERLIVTRTFSKAFGLAGLRCGYGIMPATMADYIERTREPFNVNSLAQLACRAALGDEEHLQKSREVNEISRQILESGLRELAGQGVSWIPSQTNFLLVDFGKPARPIYEAMLEQGVIVRPMAGYGLPNHLRISLGSQAETRRCVQALRRVLDA